MKITKIFKQLICGHEWQRVKEDATWSEWRCVKCNKTTTRELADFY